jgi:hypothetical protein
MSVASGNSKQTTASATHNDAITLIAFEPVPTRREAVAGLMIKCLAALATLL